jgi:hypothetical protein
MIGTACPFTLVSTGGDCITGLDNSSRECLFVTLRRQRVPIATAGGGLPSFEVIARIRNWCRELGQWPPSE